MFRFLYIALLLAATQPCHAWNGAGHRLIAVIAWGQLSPDARHATLQLLEHHPDYPRWKARAGSDEGALLLAEASTWPDDIRNDARFFDETRDTPTAPLPGFPDRARHRDWHYVDLDAAGKRVNGQLDRQITRLSSQLRSTGNLPEIALALPWLVHLLGDVHQPLHVGREGDEGGNAVEIENPFNPRLPFTNLHTYWDDLPGSPRLRGRRLLDRAAALQTHHTPPTQGNVTLWMNESHGLLKQAYPRATGDLLPLIDERFHQQSQALTEQRLVDAGIRLGRLLNTLLGHTVPRETP